MGKVIFDIGFMIQSHAESMKIILGAIQDLLANQQLAQPFQPNLINYGRIGCASWQILSGSQDFFHTFSMALYHKWHVKNDKNVLQLFSLISDGLGGVFWIQNQIKFIAKKTWRKKLPLILRSEPKYTNLKFDKL